MASIGAAAPQVEALLHDAAVVLAGLNAPHQTVIAGATAAVAAVVARAQAQHLRAVVLPVSHAFHSPLVAAAVPVLARQLRCEACQALQRLVVSTVTGAPLPPDVDLHALLCRQVTAPVRFHEAMMVANEAVDLWLELGPGSVLSDLLAECVATPTVPLDAGGPSLRGLLRAVGAAFVLGAAVD
jgi:enediyne polyketide synthase